ncbi:MAG TPA: translation initiation factor IF-3 [Ignavibacteriales bacterium]|nr:translation initiation factor IF-3 [Ignavibacteriales bacterium]HOL81556.1 translation initiation factor IF-3 [Ignavibacteriales bacterium]HOM65614.1 translation initiation factor IF-3 [Ignavibacteriales bacterium]HPD67822.1 translation initiation factor IF-3 [Ignavibacteriales bacterium]HPP33670.1 translation initiation factor IF-3 [Ignavibacteriales bacterium]
MGGKIAQDKLKNRVNEEITAKEVRVIGPDGTQLGIMDIKSALEKAEELELDLIEIAPQANPPVCRILNLSKYIYETQKKEKLQKKNQVQVIVKEIRLHPNTDTNDVEFKARHATEFLQQGNKVKVSVLFKGRELAYTEQGENLLKRFIEKLGDIAKMEQDIKMEGRNMSILLAPNKSKKKK